MRRGKTARSIVACLVIGALAAACSGGDGAAGSTAPAATGSSPAPGSTTSVADDVSIVWQGAPADEFAASVEDAPNPNLDAHVVPAASTVRLTGTVADPFTIVFEVGPAPSPEAVPVIAHSDGTSWEYVAAEWDAANGTASATADHFSWWTVLWADVSALVAEQAQTFLGSADTSELACSDSLPPGWSVEITGGTGTDLDTCSRLDGATLLIEIKNRRQTAFLVTLAENWTWRLTDSYQTLAGMVSEFVFNSFGLNTLVLPAGQTALITVPTDPNGGDNHAEVPIDQDMLSWSVDALITTAAVASRSSNASAAVKSLGNPEAVRGLLDCMNKTRAFADSLGVAPTSEMVGSATDAAWTCLGASGKLGVLAVVGSISSALLAVWGVGELLADVVTGESIRMLEIRAVDAAVALTSCEGVDTSLASGFNFGAVVCVFPYALMVSSDFNGSPTEMVDLVDTLDRRVLASWYEVEDGPGVSGYTVDAIVAAGVPPAVAQLLFESLTTSSSASDGSTCTTDLYDGTPAIVRPGPGVSCEEARGVMEEYRSATLQGSSGAATLSDGWSCSSPSAAQAQFEGYDTGCSDDDGRTFDVVGPGRYGNPHPIETVACTDAIQDQFGIDVAGKRYFCFGGAWNIEPLD